MCPACLANLALVAGSVMSTGGMAALAAKAVGSKKNGRNDNSSKTTEKRNGDAYIEHGNDDQQEWCRKLKGLARARSG